MPIMYTFYSHKINYKYICIVLCSVRSDHVLVQVSINKSTVDQHFINNYNYHIFDL